MMDQAPATLRDGQSRSGLVPYRVLERTVESSVITSFRLAPVAGGEVPAFRPGQYLTLRLPDGQVRTYTVSSSPDDRHSYRLSVKREPSPPGRPDVPPGYGSGHLHDAVVAGSVIEVLEPRGAFVLDETSARPVVLLSGGVGLTPMVSMLHRLATTDRKVHFIHACEDSKVHAHRAEVLQVASSNASLRAHFVYRTPSADDISAQRCNSVGVVDRRLLQSLLPLDDYDFYLCGPSGFMKAVYATLLALGVTKPRIKYEFFGPATVLEPDVPAVQVQTIPAASPPVESAVGGTEIVFARSGKTARWGDFKGTLLDFAEQQGLTPEFSCRAGICNSCECDLLEGSVSYEDQPLDPPADGKVLICLARPVGPRLLLDI